MKERKNVIWVLGVVFSLSPLISYIVKTLKKVDAYMEMRPYLSIPDIGNVLLSMIVHLLLFALIVILAVLQYRCNCRKNSNRTLPTLGIVVSSICLVFNILSVLTEAPSVIIHQSLNLLSVRYFINKFLINFIITGIIGNILLMITYVLSLPKRKM